MHAKILAVVMLVLPLSHAYVHNKTLPTFAECDEKFISGIKQYWKTAGTPEHVLKKLQEDGRYVAVHTSYDHLNSENKCVYMDASDENKTLTFTFLPKDGSTPGVITYNIKEGEDGSLYDEEKNMRWYTTALSQGIEVNYVCSVTGGAKIPALGSVFLAKNKFSPLIQPVIGTFNQLLSGMGVNFLYNYGAECFEDSKSGSILPRPSLLPSLPGLGH